MYVVSSLKKGIAAGEHSSDLARKLFLSYQTMVFKDNEDLEYTIKNTIKQHLKMALLGLRGLMYNEAQR